MRRTARSGPAGIAGNPRNVPKLDCAIIVSQFHKCAKNHRLLHLKWANFVISIVYLNKTVWFFFFKAYVISSFFNFPNGGEDLTHPCSCAGSLLVL